MSEPKPLLKPLAPPTVEPRLWLDGRFVEDGWRPLADDEIVPATGHVFVSLPRWQRQSAHLRTLGVPLGLTLATPELADPQVPHLGDLAVIALSFPKFTDGRAYSTAHRLRAIAGYRGELRATGDVLLDQIPLMLRAGFNAFEIRHAPTIAALERGELPALPNIYQPTTVEDRIRDWHLRRRAA